MITNFHSKKMLKEKEPYQSLSIIMLDFVIKARKVLSAITFGRMQI